MVGGFSIGDDGWGWRFGVGVWVGRCLGWDGMEWDGRLRFVLVCAGLVWFGLVVSLVGIGNYTGNWTGNRG